MLAIWIATVRAIVNGDSFCCTGDRQDTDFSPGSGTQTASRFSSTSCRGSSYFSCCWPWWRPSLGRPPVPACRTSTGTPPIQCKSSNRPTFRSFSPRRAIASLFRIIIFHRAEITSDHRLARASSNAVFRARGALRASELVSELWLRAPDTSIPFVPSQESRGGQ